jgi:hypothetical protein
MTIAPAKGTGLPLVCPSCDEAALMKLRANLLGAALSLALGVACDKEPSNLDTRLETVQTQAAPPTTPSVEPPRAPEIIVDATNISIGAQRVPAGEPGLADKVAVLVTGQPMIADQAVDFVAMRSAKPSHVAAVAWALRRARANGVNVKTSTRNDTTQKIPLSFASVVADCAAVAWIAKDAAIDVWPAGGGTAKRIIKGMAGPDMTLGGEAVQKQTGGCGANELLVGADDRFSWGLVFDLATLSLQAPGSRVSTAVLVTNAVPGRKVALEAP